MSGPGLDASVTLGDGRVLEYWEGGDPDGRPVVYHPGTPVTRLLGRWGHEAAVAAGVRLVAINRPGYGASTLARGVPSLRAVGTDTVEVATRLGMAEFAVFGCSGGGPYACATAIVGSAMVRALGVVGGVGPWRILDDPSSAAEDRACLALLDAGDAAGAWACLAQTVEDERRHLTPGQFVDAVFDGDASSLTQDPAYRELWARNVRDVQQHPDGYTYDNLAWGGRWDIDPHDVVAPSLLFYGTDDGHCPAEQHGQWYADRITGSSLVVVSSTGHMDVIDAHWPEVLAGLLRIWA
jgi:pimeloyl-ACP methyl ester carboxylesterase